MKRILLLLIQRSSQIICKLTKIYKTKSQKLIRLDRTILYLIFYVELRASGGFSTPLLVIDRWWFLPYLLTRTPIKHDINIFAIRNRIPFIINMYLFLDQTVYFSLQRGLSWGNLWYFYTMPLNRTHLTVNNNQTINFTHLISSIASLVLRD